MWKNTAKPDGPQMAKWRMRIACWKPKATYTHLEYVIHIDFPLQQWLHEHASVLRYTSIFLRVFLFFLCACAKSSCLSFCPLVFVCVCVCVCVWGGGVFRMEQLGSQWTNSHGIWYLSIFRKSVGKLKVSLKRDKNNGYITCRAIYIYDLLA